MKVRKSELKIIYDIMVVEESAYDRTDATMYWQSLSGRERKPYIRRMKLIKKERVCK